MPLWRTIGCRGSGTVDVCRVLTSEDMNNVEGSCIVKHGLIWEPRWHLGCCKQALTGCLCSPRCIRLTRGVVLLQAHPGP